MEHNCHPTLHELPTTKWVTVSATCFPTRFTLEGKVVVCNIKILPGRNTQIISKKDKCTSHWKWMMHIVATTNIVWVADFIKNYYAHHKVKHLVKIMLSSWRGHHLVYIKPTTMQRQKVIIDVYICAYTCFKPTLAMWQNIMCEQIKNSYLVFVYKCH